MPNKSRSKDTKPSADKRTLNPPSGGPPPSGAPPEEGIPSGLTNANDPDQKIGQFTGRGSPGLQKR